MTPRLEEEEIAKYWQIFNGLGPIDGKLSGPRISAVMKNSQLGDAQLGKIWDLSDIDADGSLDFEEFCVAMRLMYDLVNGNISSVPDKLPKWLIPSSKLYILQANRAVEDGDEVLGTTADDFEPPSDGLSNDFDWYISPDDKLNYNAVYSASCDRYGAVTFDALASFYASLNSVPPAEIRKAWDLVNPKQNISIGKDQCEVYLHILTQRNSGKRIPPRVPASLRATFEKDNIEYNLDKIERDSERNAERNADRDFSGSNRNSKSSLANFYATTIRRQSSDVVPDGTDFSATKDTDWEEVRLKRQLADLEEKLRRTEELMEQRKKQRESRERGESTGGSTTALVRREFEQLLEYKEKKLAEAQRGVGSTGAVPLASVRAEIETMEAHLESLEEHLDTRKKQLAELVSQIDELRAGVKV